MLYPHEHFEDEIFTENAIDWDEGLLRKEKPELVRFMAMSGNEQLDFLEQTIGAVVVAQAQQEGIEQTMDRSEAQRLVDDDFCQQYLVGKAFQGFPSFCVKSCEKIVLAPTELLLRIQGICLWISCHSRTFLYN
jgi:hypothetical protein